MEGGSKMTREEQIKKQANIYIGHPQDLEEDICITNMRNDFIEGAKWADEHPNISEEEQIGMGGLGMTWQKKALIDKACEWLLSQEEMIGISFENDFIERFKKAMEE